MSLSAEDAFEILQLVTEADHCASARDVDGYVDLFTDDAVITGAMGRASGRAELAATVAAEWFEEPSGTLRLTLNPIIDETADETTVDSVMLMVIPDGSPRLLRVRRVRQTVRWTTEGWRIAVRESVNDTG